MGHILTACLLVALCAGLVALKSCEGQKADRFKTCQKMTNDYSLPWKDGRENLAGLYKCEMEDGRQYDVTVRRTK